MWKQHQVPSIDEWISKMYTYRRILFSFKKEQVLTHATVDEPRGHYAEWSKPDTKTNTLYESAYMRYLKQSKPDSRMVAPRSVGRNAELVYLTPLNCALKDAKVYIKYISPLLSPPSHRKLSLCIADVVHSWKAM